MFPHVSPGSDSADTLVGWFCDNSPQSVYKLAKSRSRANTGFGGISDLLNVEIKKFQSSDYSVSYGLTALKLHHDIVHQKVGQQHI